MNGGFVTRLTFPEADDPGDVSIITGYFKGHEVPGGSTKFRGFRVSAPEHQGEENGDLSFDGDDQIDIFHKLIEVKDFIAGAEFTKPVFQRRRTLELWAGV